MVGQANRAARHACATFVLVALLALTLAVGEGQAGATGTALRWSVMRARTPFRLRRARTRTSPAPVKTHSRPPCCRAWNESAVVTWAREPSKHELVAGLARVARLPPPGPANASCGLPALPPKPACTGATAFNGTALARPRRIAYMMQLGFESDTLEIALREVVDVVDAVFLVECTRTHNAQGAEARVGKPLLWEHVKGTARFSFVPPGKVVHVVVDDAESQGAAQASDDLWSMEHRQMDVGVEHVKQWASATGRLAPDDLLISGDVDEVVARRVLHQLRWCALTDTVVSSGLWMPLGRLDTAFRPDWTPPGMPLAFSLPTAYVWDEVASGRWPGRRAFTLAKQRPGAAWKSTAGGMHMTSTAFMPAVLLKEMTTTDYSGDKAPAATATSLASLDAGQAAWYDKTPRPNWRARMVPLSDLPPQEAARLRSLVPWWLACNPHRYPYWHGRPDPRNAALLYVLQQVAANASYDDVETCYRERGGGGGERAR